MLKLPGQQAAKLAAFRRTFRLPRAHAILPVPTRQQAPSERRELHDIPRGGMSDYCDALRFDIKSRDS